MTLKECEEQAIRFLKNNPYTAKDYCLIGTNVQDRYRIVFFSSLYDLKEHNNFILLFNIAQYKYSPIQRNNRIFEEHILISCKEYNDLSVQNIIKSIPIFACPKWDIFDVDLSRDVFIDNSSFKDYGAQLYTENEYKYYMTLQLKEVKEIIL